jgi:hypothetical protein
LWEVDIARGCDKESRKMKATIPLKSEVREASLMRGEDPTASQSGTFMVGLAVFPFAGTP